MPACLPTSTLCYRFYFAILLRSDHVEWIGRIGQAQAVEKFFTRPGGVRHVECWMESIMSKSIYNNTIVHVRYCCSRSYRCYEVQFDSVLLGSVPLLLRHICRCRAQHRTAAWTEHSPILSSTFSQIFFLCFVLSGTEQAWCFSSVLLLLNRPIQTPVTVPEYLARALAVHYCVVFPSGSYACPMIWFSTNMVWTCLMALYVEFLFISHTYPAWELPFVLVHKLYF